MSYTCLRLPSGFDKSLNAGHIKKVNDLTLAEENKESGPIHRKALPFLQHLLLIL